MSHLRRTFFGLNDEYIKNVYEQFFFLKYYGSWSFMEAYNLPVVIRDWFVKRLLSQLEKEKQEHEKAMKEASRGGR